MILTRTQTKTLMRAVKVSTRASSKLPQLAQSTLVLTKRATPGIMWAIRMKQPCLVSNTTLVQQTWCVWTPMVTTSKWLWQTVPKWKIKLQNSLSLSRTSRERPWSGFQGSLKTSRIRCEWICCQWSKPQGATSRLPVMESHRIHQIKSDWIVWIEQIGTSVVYFCY